MINKRVKWSSADVNMSCVDTLLQQLIFFTQFLHFKSMPKILHGANDANYAFKVFLQFMFFTENHLLQYIRQL